VKLPKWTIAKISRTSLAFKLLEEILKGILDNALIRQIYTPYRVKAGRTKTEESSSKLKFLGFSIFAPRSVAPRPIFIFKIRF